jgi:hypothetical protein
MGPKAKFTSRLVVWVPDETAAAYERLAERGLLKTSDYLRDALDTYLRQRGINPAPPMQNGAAHHQPAE